MEEYCQIIEGLTHWGLLMHNTVECCYNAVQHNTIEAEYVCKLEPHKDTPYLTITGGGGGGGGWGWGGGWGGGGGGGGETYGLSFVLILEKIFRL